jgi:hypothetical protein
MRQVPFVVDAQGFVPALTKAWQVAYLSFCLRFSRMLAAAFAFQGRVATPFSWTKKSPFSIAAERAFSKH